MVLHVYENKAKEQLRIMQEKLVEDASYNMSGVEKEFKIDGNKGFFVPDHLSGNDRVIIFSDTFQKKCIYVIYG